MTSKICGFNAYIDEKSFIYMFVEGISLLTKANPTRLETQVLFQTTKYTIDGNMVVLNSTIKDIIMVELGISAGTLRTFLTNLVKKGLYIKDKRTYFLNPLIFGKGNFSKVKMLRQNFNLTFDLDSQAVEVDYDVETLNKDEDIEASKQFQMVQDDHFVEDGIDKKIVVVKAVDKNNSNFKDSTFDYKNNSELEILEQKNRSMELEIELKKSSIEELNLKLKVHKMRLI